MKKLYALLIFSILAFATFAQVPQIEVNPVIFSEELEIGQTMTVTATITNTGNRDLNWSISNVKTHFEKPNYADWNLPENQDRIADNVWITRQNSEGIYNAALQSNFDNWGAGSPLGTQWAAGTTYDVQTTYMNFMDLCQALTTVSPWSGDYSCYMPLFASSWFDDTFGYVSLYLQDEDEYYDVDFLSWTIGSEGGGGGFAWDRYDVYSWITPLTLNGSLTIGSSVELQIELDATNLPNGIHVGTLVIASNDPMNPEILIDFELTVIGGVPSISVNPLSLSYGSKPITGIYSLPLGITNEGTSELVISSLTTSSDAFWVEEEELMVPAGEEIIVNVHFNPTEEIEYSDNLVLVNNVEGQSPLEIALSGTGVAEPGITATPNSYTESLVSGETTTAILSIENTGGSILEWSLGTRPSTPGAFIFEKHDYADWTLTGNMDPISPNVAITRQNEAGIFNIAQEGSFNSGISPSNTLWAFGYSGQVDFSKYEEWRDAVDGNPPAMVNQQMSMYLVEENQFIDIKFLSWTENAEGGGFSYQRDATLQFVGFNSYSGVVNPAESVDVEVLFDATYLPAGVYEGFIQINTNIPSNQLVEIPVSLTVSGNELIEVDPVTLDFGDIIVGAGGEESFIITNTGTDILEISSIVSDNELFTVDDLQTTILPGNFHEVGVLFSPSQLGEATGTISITNSYEDKSVLTVNLIGNGIGSPVVDVNQTPIEQTLVAGSTELITLAIGNTGPTMLVGDMLSAMSDPVLFQKADYADATQEENQDRITDNVWLTRASTRGLFNAKVESVYNWDTWESPKNTLWIFGSVIESPLVDFDFWRDAVGGDPPSMVDNVVGMYSEIDKRFFDFHFHSWTEDGNGGGFSYTRYEVPSWLKIEERFFDLAESASVDKQILLDATELNAGVYQASIFIRSNDVESPEVEIPVTLTVTGTPEITAPTLIEFVNTPVGFSTNKMLTITNTGSDVLAITDISNTLSVFTFDPITEDIIINPGESYELQISFTPEADQLYEDLLTITSDDPVNPSLDIDLTGTGLFAANIVLSTQEIDAWLAPDVEESFPLVIENSGDEELNWTIEEFTVQFIKPDLADWTNSLYQDRISDNVWITRKSTQGIFNIAQENGYSSTSPIGTQWSFGLTADLTPADYQNWIDAVSSNPQSMIDQDMSLYLVEEDKYFDVVFQSYSGGGTAGGFSYTRQEVLPDWLSFSQTTGTVAPGESVTIDVIINTSGMYGLYSCNFGVTNNDPLNEHLPVTVNLKVGGVELSSPIDDIRVNPEFVSYDIDITDVFTSLDVTPLDILVASSNADVVTVGLVDNLLTLTEVGVGNSVISLRAEDDGGNVVYDDFLFMVNIAPEVVSPIDDIEQEEGFITFTIDLNEVFADANNDELNYSATSDDQSVVSVSVDAGVLTVVEVGVGSSTIEVVADDGMANVSESFVFTVTPFVSVSTFADANFKLYPNPTRGNVSLQLPSLFSGERIDVRVYSTIGQLVYHKKLSVIDKGLVEVNLSSLPQGVYYLRISSSNQIVGSKPIVIQK